MITSSSTAASQGIQIKKNSILVVDDNPTALHLLASILEKEGYEISRATNGLEV